MQALGSDIRLFPEILSSQVPPPENFFGVFLLTFLPLDFDTGPLLRTWRGLGASAPKNFGLPEFQISYFQHFEKTLTLLKQ
jgi:hypothetical protein